MNVSSLFGDRCFSGDSGFRICELPGYLVQHLVDVDIARAAGLVSTSPMRPKVIQDILDRQSGKPARTFPDMGGHATPLDLVRTKDSYRELCAYLDEHVPDDRSDYTFAEEVARSVVLRSRHVHDSAEALGIISEYDFDPSDSKLSRLSALVAKLMNDVPRWDNNGWSPNELGDVDFERRR